MTEVTIAGLLAAAGQSPPRLAVGLVDRLTAAGSVRGARAGGRAGVASALGSIQVSGVAYDSRRVRPGSVFVAIPGQHVDGHEFLDAARDAGASLAIVEHAQPAAALDQIVVDDARRALATAAAWWFGDPSLELTVIGITGTDGKTTTAFLATAALERAGVPAGLVGTVETKVGPVREANPGHVTTPEAPELQAALRAMVTAGDRAAVVETTSHGLALHRVDEIAYDVAVFTNLTHEHLELHGTFEAYRAAKLSLFERLAGRTRPKSGPPKAGIVNVDDPSGALFEAVTREAGARVIRFGTAQDADVRAVAVAEDALRLRVDVEAPRWSGRLDLRLAGRFNVHNALAVVALGEALDLDPEAIRAGLGSVDGVPGRMERLDAGQPFGVVIDYAHSPASLEKVLAILAPVAAARGGGLVAVFGSAGDRDRAKRAMMGRVAGERCRLVVATDEDPRGEEPAAILDEIGRGAEAAGRRRGVDLLLIPDRPSAIAAAFERARPGDIVLLAGKGHERSIIYGSEARPYDERAAALAALEGLGYRR
jgi:UDP-N-acetylmuramoyl-L-alanyl-D-glutamate--2,6-diaminopimelate ligase